MLRTALLATLRRPGWIRTAKPTEQAKFANFVSYERPYVDTLTMEQTTLPNVILAHSMDDAPLSRAHGGPVRLVIPQMYGYKNVKWLRRIELVPTWRGIFDVSMAGEALLPGEGARIAATSFADWLAAGAQ